MNYYLREWRIIRGLSQTELAKRASNVFGKKVPRERISDIERGALFATDELEAALAKVLRISPSELEYDPWKGLR